MMKMPSPLSGIKSPFGRMRFSIISTLFANNEAGVWYDPSQAANLDWLRNLLTWSEQFENAGWAKTRASVTANATIAPDGTTTSDKLVEDTTATSDHFATQVFTGTTATHTYSVYAKAAERSQIRLRLFNGTTFVTSVYFDLAAGTAGAGGTIQDVGSGWYRCSISGTLASSASCQARVSTAVASSDSYTGNGTSGLFLWGAQLELGSTATEYQRITDVNTEVMERFPQATLFQDTAGTIPVTTAGQTVGLMLDKSKGLVLGPELRGAGSVTTVGTVTAGSYNTATGEAVLPRVDGSNVNIVAFSGTVAKTVFVDVQSTSAAGVTIRSGSVVLVTVAAGQRVTCRVAIASGQSLAIFPIADASTTTATIHSVKELAGNHATQATAASRPTYGIVPFGGRRNLLTFTEDFSNAVWTKQATGTGVLPVVTANAVVAPDGTTTAEQIVFNKGAGTTVNDQSNIRQIVSTTSVTSHSIWLRADAPVIIVMRNPLNNGTYFQVDVTTSWQRFIFTDPNTPASASVFEFGLRANVGVSVPNTATVYAWGAQLEAGSTATAYQRVTTQYDVTEAGVPPVAYLAFDGVDDGMVTPTINPESGVTPIGPELAPSATISGAAIGGPAFTTYDSASVEVGNWYRVSFVVSGYSGTGSVGVINTGVTGNTSSPSTTFAGNGSISFSFVAMETGTVKFFTRNTNTANFSSISIREASGAADKVQVFAGLRKLSDAAAGVMLESSTAYASNSGVFTINAPTGAGQATYGWGSKGTVSAFTTSSASFAAPITNVLTGIGDISGDTSILRLNGNQAAQNTGDQGTGNYLAYPLYIGRRGGTSLPFNGQLYSLIARFGDNLSNNAITSIETYVASKTGVTL